MAIHLEHYFPNLLPGEYRETSPQSKFYNCFAYALNVTNDWYDPDEDYKWITNDRDPTIAGYANAFRVHGFELCDTGDIESGYEKIAIYAYQGMPTHAARQKQDGTWTSKLGEWEDISHTLDGLTGTPSPNLPYGSVVLFLKRRHEETHHS